MGYREATPGGRSEPVSWVSRTVSGEVNCICFIYGIHQVFHFKPCILVQCGMPDLARDVWCTLIMILICIIYSIEGRLIRQIADRGPREFRYRPRREAPRSILKTPEGFAFPSLT